MLKKRIIKSVRVNINKCTGCRACEMACSALHSVPKYSSLNPTRSRIRVFVDEVNDKYVPVRAGDYTPAECAGRTTYAMHGKEYEACAFCKASCPSRNFFKEPDSGLPLKCDMCEGEDEPLCVRWCITDALVLEEREEEIEETVPQEELEVGLASLADKHGLQKIMDAVTRMSKAKKG